MLTLLNRTSREAKLLFWTCPDTHQRLRWCEDEPLDKETIEERSQDDLSMSLNADADDTTEPSAKIEPLASPSQPPAVVELEEDYAAYEEVRSQAEPSSSSATSPTASCQMIQHILANASHFTIGQLNQTNYGMDREEFRILLVQALQANSAQHGLSQPVGYTRKNGVRIVDALGGELVLPPSIMGQYSDVHNLMLKHFNGKLGEERVVKSRYCIVTECDGTLVQPENWDHVLSSGQGLIMCMTVEKVWVESVKDTCPQCGKTTLGTYQEGGWLICRRCEKRFRSSVDSISTFRRPPPRDDKITSFRHIRKVFVERSPYYWPGSPPDRDWLCATQAEESLFEGEVYARPRFERNY